MNEFYKRPMVARLQEIFDHPAPPVRVTEQQFDEVQEALVRTAAKAWHEIGHGDFWQYLMDLAYVDLQQDLFDHLFPAFLICWWEGQLSRFGGPESECDFYYAIDRGQVLVKMMKATRRKAVLEWMLDAYMDGVDHWDSNLFAPYDSNGPNNLHGPLWSFNALGQSFPILEDILSRLGDVSNLGRARWWLVFASGLVWNENECPWVPAWSPSDGGGGVYIAESGASIFDHGFLADNLRAITAFFTYPNLKGVISATAEQLRGSPYEAWSCEAEHAFESSPDRMASRLQRLLHLYNLPGLGGVLSNPLEPS